MHIPRPKLTQTVHNFLDSQDQHVCLLFWPRQAGKTTLLKHVYDEFAWWRKKSYFSFDEDIVPRQFHDIDEFLMFMMMKYGFDPYAQHLLCLNEVQYSHNLEKVLEAYTHIPWVKAKILATGVVGPLMGEQEKIVYVPVFPLSFHEFLQVKEIHIDHISLKTTSKIILKELQWVYDEYLTWGWYPRVLTAQHPEEKTAALKTIMQAVYEKDIGFFFNGHDILQFEPMLRLAYHATKTVYKISTLAKFLDCKSSLVEQYMSFFSHHHLIELMDYSTTSPDAKEIHHQKKLLFTDTWAMTYLTKDMTTKLTSLWYQMSFLYRELRDHPGVKTITTYKKINWSVIDFIVELVGGGTVLICCDHDQRTVLPKVIPAYLQIAWDSVIGVIKTGRLVNQVSQIQNKTGTIPFMVTQPFLVHEAIRFLIARQSIWRRPST
jgi:predicted AAA+ superfamily ATPase